jgi:hypothetical protein
MCDYSLVMIPNRPTIDGEELVATGFKAMPQNLRPARRCASCRRTFGGRTAPTAGGYHMMHTNEIVESAVTMSAGIIPTAHLSDAPPRGIWLSFVGNAQCSEIFSGRRRQNRHRRQETQLLAQTPHDSYYCLKLDND